MKDCLIIATLQVLQLAVILWGFYLIVYHTLGKNFFRYSPGAVLGRSLNALVQAAWWLLKQLGILAVDVLGTLFDTSSERTRSGGRRVAGAHFLHGIGRWRLINRFQGGLVIDGTRRISREASYRHMLVAAPTGSGKTTGYVIPNLLRAKTDRSMIVTDPSGELFERTSGFLARSGFDILMLNLGNPDASHGYNPLHRVNTPTEIEQLCSVLVESAYGTAANDHAFWRDGAKTLLSVLIRVLKQQAPEYQNLNNLYALTNRFGSDGRALYRLIARHADRPTFDEFKGFLSNSEKVVQGMAATARTALKPLSDPALCRLTATDTISFEALRERPTVLYLVVPEHQFHHYSPLLTFLWSQLFSFMMAMPREGEAFLPIYAFMDEFGSLGRIPGFEQVITAVRKRRVSLSLVVQDTQQVVAVYGRAGASTILNGGCASKLYLPGLGHEMTRSIEQVLGRQTLREDGRDRSQSLMSADAIRTLGDREALYVFGNRKPARLRTTPFYKSIRLRGRSKLPPVQVQGHVESDLAYLPLDTARATAAEARAQRQQATRQKVPVALRGNGVDDAGESGNANGAYSRQERPGSEIQGAEHHPSPSTEKASETPKKPVARPQESAAIPAPSEASPPEPLQLTAPVATDEPEWARTLLRESRRARQEVAGLRDAIGTHVVTRKEAARILGRSTRTVARYEKQGLLERVEIKAPGVHYDHDAVISLKRRVR